MLAARVAEFEKISHAASAQNFAGFA